MGAAVKANGKYFRGPSHYFAAQKARMSGDLLHYIDEQGKDRYYCPDGKRWLELFYTNKGQYLTRDEADEYFGIRQSEDIAEQKPTFV